MPSEIAHVHDLSTAVFRANAGYRLVPLDKLDRNDYRALGIIDPSQGIAAVLIPTEGSHASIKAIDAETAALFGELHEARPLVLVWTSAINRAVARLVLDGLIEIEHAGRFVSGAAARQAVLEAEVEDAAEGRLARLALDAVHHVQSLGIEETTRAATRLYFYNRLPVTACWLALWPDAVSVLRYLTPDESTLRAAGFTQTPLLQSSNAWIAWKTQDQRLALSASASTFKLYLSPMPGEERAVFAAMTQIAREHACSAFKVGADAYGLLRPDKMILYFTELHSLKGAAAALAVRLAGCRALGVPFSAELAINGLLSWGIDPPRTDAFGLVQGAESWRLKVVNKLAAALAQCQRCSTEEARRFAFARLQLDGIDTRRWQPLETSIVH